ncbi:MAG: YbaB/EbfC family nucleoid-associated protein [Clostridiales bacterium]|jgi:DNA-binding YbaB/EbfC family protein|nr:YbaB/EbfC family nucleoid-associated protein [Clostridiales bacterium]
MAKNRFTGVGGGGNMNNMLRQAQKMQQEIENTRQEMEQRVVGGSSGGGAVTVTVSGKKELKSVKIDPEVIDAGDTEMLEDLILTAVNEALTKAEDMMSSEMGKIAGGLNIPGLF